MDKMIDEVLKHTASSNTKYYCVHAYIFLGLPLKYLAIIFSKSPQTISNWIKKFHVDGNFT